MFRDSLLIFGTVAGQSQLSLCRPHDETWDELTHGLVYRFIHVLGGGRAAERRNRPHRTFVRQLYSEARSHINNISRSWVMSILSCAVRNCLLMTWTSPDCLSPGLQSYHQHATPLC